MGIGVKDIGNFMQKVLEFSMNTSNGFVRYHAVVPGLILFFFILCIFLPSVSLFLLYSSPILVCIGLYVRNSSNTRLTKSDISSREKNNVDEASLSALRTESVSSNNSKKYLRPQRSVRRNARREVEEVGKDWDSLASDEEKDKVILTSIYNELLGRKTPPSFEDPSDEMTFPSKRESWSDETIEGSICRPRNIVADPFENLASDWGETTKVEGSEEDDDDEQNQESRNKAVEWNEDDEKNLMDLGFSEIERNKRLEVLIARRRMRKLLLLAAEKSLMDMEIPSICVGRNYFDLDLQNTHDFDGLQMPGSAPSVLSPSRNPFDLPYEPQEERPNLTGDSFQQEFTVANQKDIFFCRHESFCCGHFPVGYIQDFKFEPYSKSKQRPIDGLRISRFSTQFNKEEDDNHPVQKQEAFCEKHHLAKGTNPETEKGNDTEEETKGDHSCPKSEVRVETDCIGKDDSDSHHSSPKESEKDFNIGNQKEVSEISDQADGKRKYQLGIRDHIRNSLIGVPRSSASSSLGSERQRYMEYFGYHTSKGRHRGTMSMDSDMHVEVSDIGSPPTTDGCNDSSDDENTSFFYESDVGKEMDSHGMETEPKTKDANYEFTSSRNEAESNLNLEKRVDTTAAPLVMQPLEVNSEMVEESQELSEKPADEIKISYGLDDQEQAPETDQESPIHDHYNYKEQSGNQLPAAEKSELSSEPTKPALEIDSRAASDAEPEISVQNAA